MLCVLSVLYSSAHTQYDRQNSPPDARKFRMYEYVRGEGAALPAD